MKYGILGHPLTHTMSPFIHKRLFLLGGKPEAEYSIFDLSAEELLKTKAVLRTLSGLNVTIPYKIAAIDLADETTLEVNRFHSLNCLMSKDGKTVGYNTDVDGFRAAVAELNASLGKNVLLLGAGGVAQMIAVTAVEEGANLTIAVRDADLTQAENLAARAAKFGKTPQVTTLANIKGTFDLLVNATPVGMYPNVNACPVADEVLDSVLAVYDLVYNPSETLLKKKASARGIPVATGMSMLVYQAVKAHEIWYGARFLSSDIAQLIQDATRFTEEHFQ